MVIARGDIVWADFGQSRGSEPAKCGPAVILQSDWLLASKINTVLVIPLTTNTRLVRFPGNVLISAVASSLEVDSVAIVSQIGPISREYLEPYPAGFVPHYLMDEIASGVRLVTGI
jgi:mRNA interferase MazF